MNLEDKILQGGEITAQGEFVPPTKACYLFLVPKTDSSASVGILNVKISQNDGYTDYPFTSGIWNPIIINKVNVKSSDLTSYRIFWGV